MGQSAAHGRGRVNPSRIYICRNSYRIPPPPEGNIKIVFSWLLGAFTSMLITCFTIFGGIVSSPVSLADRTGCQQCLSSWRTVLKQTITSSDKWGQSTAHGRVRVNPSRIYICRNSYRISPSSGKIRPTNFFRMIDFLLDGERKNGAKTFEQINIWPNDIFPTQAALLSHLSHWHSCGFGILWIWDPMDLGSYGFGILWIWDPMDLGCRSRYVLFLVETSKLWTVIFIVP